MSAHDARQTGPERREGKIDLKTPCHVRPVSRGDPGSVALDWASARALVCGRERRKLIVRQDNDGPDRKRPAKR